MFNIFNKKADGGHDVKSVRDAILGAIKERLQKAEGGEGRNIKGINLFIALSGNDKQMYEAAVYTDEQGRFAGEIQKIADDFAIDLPANWELEISFTDDFPVEAIAVEGLNAAIFIRTKDNAIQKTGSAYIRVLNGEAEKAEYPVSSADGKINIGREKRPQVDEGFFRLNHIAFPGDKKNDANKYVSRQHAHIEWNNDRGGFMLFADDGGVPPGNKIKIRAANGELIKLNSTHIGHHLQEGDQVILGESAVIEFSYKKGTE